MRNLDFMATPPQEHRIRMTKFYFLFTIFPLVLVLICPSSQDDKVKQIAFDGDIVIGGLFPVHQRSAVTENACGEINLQPGFQYLAAMLFALERINNNTNLLKNITLGAKIYDTCRSQTIGADRARELIKYAIVDHDSPLAGVIGPFVSDVSIAVANLLRVFDIPQISYGSTSPDLSNKELYSYFFRTVPSDSFQGQALVDILKRFGWTYVFTVHSSGNYGQKGIAEFHKAAKEVGICIARAEKLPYFATSKDFLAVIKNFMDPGFTNVRVIVMFTTQSDSAGMLHAATMENVRRFTWIGNNAWSNRVDVTAGNEAVADGAITVSHLHGTVDGYEEYLQSLTLENSNHNPWIGDYWQALGRASNSSRSKNGSAPHSIELAPVRVVVNAVYALAHGLDKLQKYYCPNSHGLCQKLKANFRRNELLSFIQNVSFPDAALQFELRFNQNQEVDGNYSLTNFHKDANGIWKYFPVGSWSGSLEANGTVEGLLQIRNEKLMWGKTQTDRPVSICSKPCNATQVKKAKNANPQCCWVCEHCSENEFIVEDTCQPCDMGFMPNKDLSTCQEIPMSFPLWTDGPAVAFTALSSLGILLSGAIAGVFIRNRNSSIIKAAGRELSSIIFIGITLCYSTTFLYLAMPSPVICGARRILGSVSFTICYVPVLLKTNRIYRIFVSAQKTTVRPLMTSPRAQVIVSFLLILVQLFLTAIWLFSDPPCTRKVYPSEQEIILECYENNYSLAVNLSYNLLLQLLCTVFAFRTRNFPRNFNEAKYIGVSMYLICSVWIVFLPSYLNTDDSFWRVYFFCSVFVLIGTIILFGLLFPKVRALLFANGRAGATIDINMEAFRTPNVTNMALESG